MQIAVGVLEYNQGFNTLEAWREANSHIKDRKGYFEKIKHLAFRVYDTEARRLTDIDLTGLQYLTDTSVMEILGDRLWSQQYYEYVAKLTNLVPLAGKVINIENAVIYNPTEPKCTAPNIGWHTSIGESEKGPGSQDDFTRLIVKNKHTIQEGVLTPVFYSGSRLCPIMIVKCKDSYKMRVVDIITGEEHTTTDVTECIANEVTRVFSSLLEGKTVQGMSIHRGLQTYGNHAVIVLNDTVEKYTYRAKAYSREATALTQGEALTYDADKDRYLYYCKTMVKNKEYLLVGTERNWYNAIDEGDEFKSGTLYPVLKLDDSDMLVADLGVKKKDCGSKLDVRAWNLDYWNGKEIPIVGGYFNREEELQELSKKQGMEAGAIESNMALEMFLGTTLGLELDSQGNMLSCVPNGVIIDLRGAVGLKPRSIPINSTLRVSCSVILGEGLQRISEESVLANNVNKLCITADGVGLVQLEEFIQSVKAEAKAINIGLNITKYSLEDISAFLSRCIINNNVIGIKVYREEGYVCNNEEEMVLVLNGNSNSLKAVNNLFTEKAGNSQDMLKVILGMTLRTLIDLKGIKDTTGVKKKTCEDATNSVLAPAEYLLFMSLAQRSHLLLDNGQAITVSYTRVKTSFYTVFKLFQSVFNYLSVNNEKKMTAEQVAVRVEYRKYLKKVYLGFIAELQEQGKLLELAGTAKDGAVVLKLSCSGMLIGLEEDVALDYLTKLNNI